jgi:hypothetical protein
VVVAVAEGFEARGDGTRLARVQVVHQHADMVERLALGVAGTALT